MSEESLEQRIPFIKPPTFREIHEDQIARILPGQYGVICIPMQVTAQCPEALYVSTRRTALSKAKKLSRIAGELTPNGQSIVRPELFDTRRYAVYDSAGIQVALYTSGVRYERRD